MPGNLDILITFIISLVYEYKAHFSSIERSVSCIVTIIISQPCKIPVSYVNIMYNNRTNNVDVLNVRPESCNSTLSIMTISEAERLSGFLFIHKIGMNCKSFNSSSIRMLQFTSKSYCIILVKNKNLKSIIINIIKQPTGILLAACFHTG
jgi:hypothetical protein